MIASRLFLATFCAAALVCPAFSAEASEDQNLVPVSFDASPIPEHNNHFGTSQRYAFHSASGEPIRFKLTTTSATTNPLGVTLSSEDGTTIDSQQLEEGEHNLALTVPGPGTYYVEITSEKTLRAGPGKWSQGDR